MQSVSLTRSICMNTYLACAQVSLPYIISYHNNSQFPLLHLLAISNLTQPQVLKFTQQRLHVSFLSCNLALKFFILGTAYRLIEAHRFQRFCNICWIRGAMAARNDLSNISSSNLRADSRARWHTTSLSETDNLNIVFKHSLYESTSNKNSIHHTKSLKLPF